MIKGFGALFSGNIIGKLIGFLRETLLAALFGTQPPVGAYRTAQSATLIPVDFLTSDTLNAAFIPLYKKYKNDNEEKAKVFLWLILSVFILISLVLTISLFSLSNMWVTLLAPGFMGNVFNLTSEFVKIMSLGIPFYILGILFSYIEMSNKSYILSSIRSTLQSTGLILGTLLGYYFNTPSFLAWGFTVSYIFYFIFGSIILVPKGYLNLPSLTRTNYMILKSIIGEFWMVIRPLLILPFLLQGNIAIEKIVGSYMGSEVIAAHEYARFITDTGVLLISVPLGLVGLAEFSSKTDDELKNTLSNIVLIVLAICMPISFFMFLNSDNIIQLLYGRGSFDSNSIIITRDILVGLSIGFWAQVIAYILVKALNSKFKNKQVVFYYAVSLGLNSLFNLTFYKILGPTTLGIGSSIYGLSLLFCTLIATGILKKVFSRIILLLFLGIIYITVAGLFKEYISNNIFTSSFMFLLIWGFLILIIPSWRRGFLSKFKK